MTDRDRCMARLAALYPALTEEQADRFGRYYTLLVEWNRTRNLTAITEPEAVAEKHFFDSLAAAPLLPAAARCIDVGTGAGFPGIPLLIVRPDLAMTLLDALQKRIDFLQAALEALGLAAQCLHLRAEDAGPAPDTGGLWPRGVRVLQRREDVAGGVTLRCRAALSLNDIRKARFRALSLSINRAALSIK